MKYIPIVAVNSIKEEISAYDIIKSKIIDHSEIVINFFDYCNMNCVFCPQDHSDKQGTSLTEILSKTDIVLDYVRKNTSTNLFLLHLMGGELFQDDLIDGGILEHFGEFIRVLESKKPDNVTFEYNFITNLALTRTDKLLDFVIKHEIELAVSYDPTGRFNQKQLELFKKNIEIFKPYIRMVSCVMTKPSIDKIIFGDQYFDYLYENFDCHWDHLLVSNSKMDYLLPSEQDIKNFYIHLVDHYPRVINVEQFLNKTQQQKMGCTRGNSLTVFSDNSIPNGCSGSAVVKDTITEYTEDSGIVGRFIEQNMCLSCEYYSRCNLTCFMNNEYKNLVRDPQGCPYQSVFKYAETLR
jgi:hypothetical protein